MKMTPAQLAMLKHLRREGKSIRKCAAIMEISRNIVWKHAAELGPLPERLPLAQVAKAVQPYGFVYVFGARDLVKVGMTMHNLYRRWHAVKTANPWLEKPLYVSPPLLGHVVEVEKAAHRALKQYRITGEWFSCERVLVVETVQRLVEEFQHA